jgi:hypothetical protein
MVYRKVEDEYGENDGGYNDNEKKPSFKWGEKAAASKNKSINCRLKLYLSIDINISCI